jgi:hypothetical protein
MSAFSLPPSLISAVHAASVHGERQAWSLASLTALAIAVFGWIVLWQSLRKWSQNRWFQFTVLFAYMASYPPLIETYFHRELLPQPDRYKIEMEAGLALVAVFGLWPLVRKLPRSIGFGLLFLLLSLGAERVVSLRRFAKAILSSVDIKQTIEYRAAVWTQENLRGVRVMMPGSIAQWTNAFTDVQQFSGSSWSMAYNPVQQKALDNIYASTGVRSIDASRSIQWVKAYGVGAICVSGKRSPEFWKPFQAPARFDGVLPVLWQVQDTTIYRIPQRSTSLAHVIPEGAIIDHLSPGLTGGRELDLYAAALNDPSLPMADFEWKDSNHIRIQTMLERQQALSVQVSYHPGWHARDRNQPVEVRRDGLGLIWLQPKRVGRCELELEYDGGSELRICRLVSAVSAVAFLLGLPVVLLMRRRRLPGLARTAATISEFRGGGHTVPPVLR